jgi:glycosyltransferase involved in cell wall biosynthesis
MISGVSVVIPTYGREDVLTNSIRSLLELQMPPSEIIIVDQTTDHAPDTARDLETLQESGRIRWLRLPRPSIPHAMNVGLKEASHDVVLFLDDDIIPEPNLIHAHSTAQQVWSIVAGQVLQPGEEPMTADLHRTHFRFCSSKPQMVQEVMAGNFSIKRRLAVELGGFDENFVRAAYRFEAEFADRALVAGEKIFFEPSASVRHLRESQGGIRAHGNHLTTFKPSHAVGEYYYLLRSSKTPHRIYKIMNRPIRAVSTGHHLRHPWWIPATLVAEALGFAWALALGLHGPRLIERPE